MNEKLISGYMAFTTEEEFGAAVTADAPATAGTLISPYTFFLHC